MNAIGDYAKDLCGLALAAMMMAALLFRVRFHVLRTQGCVLRPKKRRQLQTFVTKTLLSSIQDYAVHSSHSVNCCHHHVKSDAYFPGSTRNNCTASRIT
jgi:hypothetical protein